MTEARWSLIVHGGARTIAAHRRHANRAGCRAAVEVGAAMLRQGLSAIDAAEYAVRHLEDDMEFNAGSGSVPTSAGKVEMAAAIMDGRTLELGAVAALSGVRHPVGVARLLMKQKPVFLAGVGAEDFAWSKGVERHEVPPAEDSDMQHDTVGCVAMDKGGHIAVATSTGGLSGQMPGRIGDAPIAGCGFYADDNVGGVAISGDGESILRVLLAAGVMEELKAKPAPTAVRNALRRLARVGGEAGIIAMDHVGRFGLVHNSDHFAVALASSWLPDAIAGVHMDEVNGYLARG